ncbi:MAG: Flp family type IVb pilin [Salaquimonas sp.]
MTFGSSTVLNTIKIFIRNESGATAIEYALIAILISVSIVGGATTLGNSINTSFTNASSNF